MAGVRLVLGLSGLGRFGGGALRALDNREGRGVDGPGLDGSGAERNRLEGIGRVPLLTHVDVGVDPSSFCCPRGLRGPA